MDYSASDYKTGNFGDANADAAVTTMGHVVYSGTSGASKYKMTLHAEWYRKHWQQITMKVWASGYKSGSGWGPMPESMFYMNAAEEIWTTSSSDSGDIQYTVDNTGYKFYANLSNHWDSKHQYEVSTGYDDGSWRYLGKHLMYKKAWTGQAFTGRATFFVRNNMAAQYANTITRVKFKVVFEFRDWYWFNWRARPLGVHEIIVGDGEPSDRDLSSIPIVEGTPP